MIGTRMSNGLNKSTLLLTGKADTNKGIFVNLNHSGQSALQTLEHTLKSKNTGKAFLSAESSRLNFSMSMLSKSLSSNKALTKSLLSYMGLGRGASSMLYKGNFINTTR